MGDRVLLQVVKNGPDREFSPVIYCHWLGSDAVGCVERLAIRMNDRRGDVQYAAARLVQEVTTGNDGNLGFGIWNAKKVLTAKDSQGDAGVILIDADTFEMTFLGGYLADGS